MPAPAPVTTTTLPCSIPSAVIASSPTLRGSRSVRTRQAEHVLGDVRIDHVGRDRRDLLGPRLANFAFDVVFVREAKPAVELQAGIGGLPARLRRQVLRHV